MKFFHVYNDNNIIGLTKNGLLNEDSGFKIQHAFSVPTERKFNEYAKIGGELHSLIKENNIPFYVDRIAGGITWHKYNFDKALIDEYTSLLGDWFLGFQLHESASNRRGGDWGLILRVMNGEKGPYDPVKLRELTMGKYKLPDGTLLARFGHDEPEEYAKLRFAETPKDYAEEIRDMVKRRMAETYGHILPCDSFYMYPRIQNEVGMKTFMPEVGSQIPMMRLQLALARGVAKSNNKTWGIYYECWRTYYNAQGKKDHSMPCFNTDTSNEWYLTQDIHVDDFTSRGENGGSSRLLQNRIYYYSLMAGAHYFSEEWGLNCSYTDMQDFSLSDYGRVKKDFINTALDFKGMNAEIPFAIVLPKNYEFIQIPSKEVEYKLGIPGKKYLNTTLSEQENKEHTYIEDIFKLCFAWDGKHIGNEWHVMTNSRMGDLFDIVYEDASDETLSKYKYLIDATYDSRISKEKKGFKVLEANDLGKLEYELNTLAKETMPCFVSDLMWLVSYDKDGKRYLSIFNNNGNQRSHKKGNIVHREADREVTITFKERTIPHLIKYGAGAVSLEKIDDLTFKTEIPAAGFAIIRF